MSTARAHALRFYGSVALGVTLVVGAVLLGGQSGSSAHAPRGAVALAVDVADWCPEGLEPITGGGCFAPAHAAARPGGLLLYLHGRYSPETANDERDRQTRVARMGTARGYAVLALRGLQGQCTDPQLATSWCWPSNERNMASGPAFVIRFRGALAEAERRAGNGRRVLLGFSNGGYFAALSVSRALLTVDAVAIAHAGPVEPMHPVRQMAAAPPATAQPPSAVLPPILLIDADDDPSGPEMDRLDTALTRESWPHVTVARPGGHELPDWDIEMALTFFDRVAAEPLPLSPPLASRSRRLPPPPDASTPPDEADASSPVPTPPAAPETPAAPEQDPAPPQ